MLSLLRVLFHCLVLCVFCLFFVEYSLLYVPYSSFVSISLSLSLAALLLSLCFLLAPSATKTQKPGEASCKAERQSTQGYAVHSEDFWIVWWDCNQMAIPCLNVTLLLRLACTLGNHIFSWRFWERSLTHKKVPLGTGSSAPNHFNAEALFGWWCWSRYELSLGC